MPELSLTIEAVVDWIRTAALSVDDRVAVVRALRDSTPDLVAVDPRLTGRIRAAQAIDPKYVDTTIIALENSGVWQQFASTDPKQLRHHRNVTENNRPLTEEVTAYGDILKYTERYHHFVGVDKSREAYKAGKQMSGDARLSIQPHLASIAESAPNTRRRRRKPEEPVPVVSPTPVPPIRQQ
jgi:hypothetical protein